MSEKSPKDIKNTCKTNIYKFRANSKKAQQVNPSPFKSAQVPWTYFSTFVEKKLLCVWNVIPPQPRFDTYIVMTKSFSNLQVLPEVGYPPLLARSDGGYPPSRGTPPPGLMGRGGTPCWGTPLARSNRGVPRWGTPRIGVTPPTAWTWAAYPPPPKCGQTSVKT